MPRDTDETVHLPPDDDTGKTVSHYRITGKVGQGGMGIVYRAEDTRLERTVALKFLPPELTRDEQAKQRFLREARAASALDHPNICTVHEFDEADGRAFIAMAYVEGQSLRDRIRSGTPLTLDEIVDIGVQAAQGLQAAHAKGIVHRDIKPANIMLSTAGQVRILDFGLATAPVFTELTKAGTTLGTVAYMSPEQARGESVDRQSDLWSLGVVLYEMIARRTPFPGDRDQTVIHAIINDDPKPLAGLEPEVDPELRAIVMRALDKDRKARYRSADELLQDLKQLQSRLRGESASVVVAPGATSTLRKPAVVIPLLLLGVLATVVIIWQVRGQARVRQAEESIAEIERLLDQARGENTVAPRLAAFELAEQVDTVLPDDPRLAELWPGVSSNITVTTTPPGAAVFIKEYSAVDGPWQPLGTTPLEQVRLPRVWLRWKFELEGHETVSAVAPSMWDALDRTLDPTGSLPEGMVRVEAQELDDETFPSFFIDRYEVTNRQFKEFVDAGGYQNRELWKHPFDPGPGNGRELSWEEAMASFVDATGRPGPATWNGGDYPDGQDDHPVSGVSWYEAAAYAEFVGKELATTAHWAMAAGHGESSQYRALAQLLLPLSNIQREDSEPAPVGEHQGITLYGAYDMAGNVREWTWETTPVGRSTCGGAWDDVYYQFGNVSQQPPLSRSPKNGIRLIVETDRAAVPEWAWKGYEDPEVDYLAETPVSDEVFEIYRSRFAYDPGELDPEIESRDESGEDWIVEKISFAAAYGNERMIIHLMLPKRGSQPPYQTVIFFPHSGAVLEDTFELERWEQFYNFLLKNGRAFVFPILRGTYERDHDGFDSAGHGPAKERRHEYTDYAIRWVKDLSRTIDYLQTREDIDPEAFAYFGVSWGAGNPAAVVTAMEQRFKASILFVGGFRAGNRPLPEADPFNYAPRVRVPTLMLNGKYDMVFDAETEVRPMFELLGVPDEDKRLVLYESDHNVPRNGLIRESLDWLDRYLGKVE